MLFIFYLCASECKSIKGLVIGKTIVIAFSCLWKWGQSLLLVQPYYETSSTQGCAGCAVQKTSMMAMSFRVSYY